MAFNLRDLVNALQPRLQQDGAGGGSLQQGANLQRGTDDPYPGNGGGLGTAVQSLEDYPEIVATGTPRQARSVPDEYREVPLDPKSQEMQGQTPELIKRKGMFGVQGTLRNILGVLGDAFLVQSGNKAQYQPQREKEKAASAQYGFTQDPLAAVERLGENDPEAARELYKMIQQAEAQKAAQQSLIAGRQDVMNDRDYKRKQDFGNYAAQLLAGATTPAKQAAALDIITKRAGAYGFDLNDLAIPENMTEDQRQILSRGNMTVNQQEALPRRDRQLDISQQNADSSTTRANRPPAGRAPRAPSVNADIIVPLLQARQNGQTLTPEQEEVLTRSGFAANRGQGKGKTSRINPGAAPASTTKAAKATGGWSVTRVN